MHFLKNYNKIFLMLPLAEVKYKKKYAATFKTLFYFLVLRDLTARGVCDEKKSDLLFPKVKKSLKELRGLF